MCVSIDMSIYISFNNSLYYISDNKDIDYPKTN